MSRLSTPPTPEPGSDSARSHVADRAYGDQPQSAVGKAAAFVTAVLSLGALVWLVATVGTVSDHPALTLDEVTESLVDNNADGSCRWLVEFQLKNNTDETAYIWAARVSVRQEGDSWLPPHGSADDLVKVILRPGRSAPGRIVVDVPECPSRVDELGHDPMIVTYEMGGDRTKRIVIGF